MLKRGLPLSVLSLAAALAMSTWYAMLTPFWAVQSGERDERVFYSQGFGLWLNYTEHVGDAAFDPGNSLWIPPQASAVDAFSSQCQAERAFCRHAVGELHIQYCQVMDVFCGSAMRALQVAMAVVAGAAVLVLAWAIVLVLTAHRTFIDRYLMQLCIFNGLALLGVISLWYFAVFRVVLGTTFYKDQFNRCMENEDQRSCWHVGVNVYFAVAGAVLYPCLALLVASLVTEKFKRFQRALRRLYDASTMVELPLPPVDTTPERPQRPKPASEAAAPATVTVAAKRRGPTASELSTQSSREVDLASQLSSRGASGALAPLQKTASGVATAKRETEDAGGEKNEHANEDAQQEEKEQQKPSRRVISSMQSIDL
ncbi:hypothetical protein ATCC90586_000033 [Pythium insidiosum]|nr:hypothetical protein ATCC90586_000033 [Pythium insidiosum]